MFPNCLVWLFLVTITSSVCEKCTNSVFVHESHLGTKTPYRVVANSSANEIKFEGCQATKLWAMVRHGTRNPDLKLIGKMRTRLPEIRDLILKNLPEATDQIHYVDLNLFQTWKSKLEEKDEKKLTHEGEDEMLFLAERMQQRFPNILNNIYSETAYEFKFTATQRTKRSAHYFASGLFGRNVAKNIDYPEPLKRDPILRFYKLCDKWRREIKKNPAAIVEKRTFEKSDLMTKTIKEINDKLGFTDELDYSDVHAMYMVCAFETAWNKKKKSPWCSVFSEDNLKVLEYAEDLKYYWVDGYGHELTYKQACPAFNNIIDLFQNGEKFPKAALYFTHSGTLLKLLAHMGLYKQEEHLTANNFNENSNRNWRVSYIDTFGTNLVFILFDCDGNDKILTMHQESIVRLPSCPDSDLCDMEKFVNYYKNSIDCTFDEMCDNPF